MLKQTNIKFKRRLTVAALIAAAITAIVPFATTSASNGTNWGPSRTLYTMKNPANEPTFNSISDNNIVGTKGLPERPSRKLLSADKFCHSSES